MLALIEKAQAIKLFIFDVDGILTSGSIFYNAQGVEMRDFHIRDGLGIKLLQQAGIHTGIISAKNSQSIGVRVSELKIPHLYLGQENKLPAYQTLKEKLALQDHEIAYMGDDLPDLPILTRVGLAITVPQAPVAIKARVDWVTNTKGGKGAVREACDFILETQGKMQDLLALYA